MRTLFALVFVAILGCNKNPVQPKPEDIPPDLKPFKAMGDAFIASHPWLKDRTPWKCWVEYEDFGPGSQFSVNAPYALVLRLHINMADERPVKNVRGTLKIAGRNGAILYDQPFTIAEDVSWNKTAFKFLGMPYDDKNAAHRALRFEKERSATFTPIECIYADGKVETY